MNPIDLAITNAESYIAELDAKMVRAAERCGSKRNAGVRAHWGARLAFLAQERDNAVRLVNGLKAIRHRPEIQDVQSGSMLRVGLKKESESLSRGARVAGAGGRILA